MSQEHLEDIRHDEQWNPEEEIYGQPIDDKGWRFEADRKKAAAFYQLPDDATWEDINRRSQEWDKEVREFSEEERKRLALVLGLPEDATWEAISDEQRDMEENIAQHERDELEDRRQRGL